MIKNDKKFICELLFMFAYTLMLSFSYFGHIATLKPYIKDFNYGALAIFLVCFLLQYKTFDFREFLILTAVIVFTAVSTYFTNVFNFFKLAVMLCAVKCFNFKKLVKFGCYLRLCLFLLMFLLFYLGIAPDVTYIYSGSVKHSLGFVNPNIFGASVVLLALEFAYISDFKVDVPQFIVLIAFLIPIWTVVGSRTSFILIVFIMAISILYTFIPKLFKNNISKNIFAFSFIFFFVITFVLVLLLNNGNGFANKINAFLSDRIRIISMELKHYPISLFGQQFVSVKSIDNVYGFLWINMGVIFTVVFTVLAVLNEIKLFRRRDYPLAIVMFCLFVFGLAEHIWVFADYNILMLGLQFLIFTKKRINEGPHESIRQFGWQYLIKFTDLQGAKL